MCTEHIVPGNWGVNQTYWSLCVKHWGVTKPMMWVYDDVFDVLLIVNWTTLYDVQWIFCDGVSGREGDAAAAWLQPPSQTSCVPMDIKLQSNTTIIVIIINIIITYFFNLVIALPCQLLRQSVPLLNFVQIGKIFILPNINLQLKSALRTKYIFYQSLL